jgi:glycerol-3-phosphate dehydrogenase
MTTPELRWDAAWRERTWSGLAGPWDLVVVGGGIVGAGILRAAALTGVRALLLERSDFASGTSSRSSQLVHGGLRYLAQGQVGLARSAVTERDRLLRDAPGLVTPLDFLFPFYGGERTRRLTYAAALTAYEALAGRHRSHRVSVSTWSGLRPTVNTFAATASRELRAHVVMDEDGLLTVTGGKLTTFRLIAHDALQLAARRLPALATAKWSDPAVDPSPAAPSDSAPSEARLAGRHGAEASDIVAAAEPGELDPLAATPVTAAELRWAARCEGVSHLDDLLLRRVRLGLLLPNGGAQIFPKVRRICQQELSWTDDRWAQEVDSYAGLVVCSHGVPG